MNPFLLKKFELQNFKIEQIVFLQIITITIWGYFFGQKNKKVKSHWLVETASPVGTINFETMFQERHRYMNEWTG